MVLKVGIEKNTGEEPCKIRFVPQKTTNIRFGVFVCVLQHWDHDVKMLLENLVFSFGTVK